MENILKVFNKAFAAARQKEVVYTSVGYSLQPNNKKRYTYPTAHECVLLNSTEILRLLSEDSEFIKAIKEINAELDTITKQALDKATK